MKRLLVLCLLPALAWATPRWHFADKQPLTGEPRAGVFHHLEGSGRKHIAVSGERTGVTWEDNSSGNPQVYLAVREPGAASFSAPRRVSSGREAWEPAIAALPEGAFALAWEQDGGVFVEIDRPGRQPVLVRLAESAAGQAALATAGRRVFVAWREKTAAGWWLRVAELEYQQSGLLRLESTRAVEPEALPTPVLFPTLVATPREVMVAWEDRRAGHTRLMRSVAATPGGAFASPAYLNEFSSNRNQYDMGNGVTRVSATRVGRDEVLAAWMDKRRSNIGYGIFAAFGTLPGGSFGPNEKVHGARGDLEPHSNPAVAGNDSGDFVVAWDDFRNGDNDLWLSSYNDDLEWSEDFAPPVASGAGEQSHASVALDDQGRLHLVWLQRKSSDAPTQIWYSVGEPQ